MDRLHRYFGRGHRTPDLEEEAFSQIYNDIIGNLILCPDHRPEGIVSLPHSSFLSLTIPELISSEHLINFVRDRLAQHLSGYSTEAATNLRKKLVKLFCTNTAKKRTLDHVDIWAFLDSVLDENFEDLETRIAFRGSEANAKLISTIAKRSPRLKKLRLSFKCISTQSPKLMPLMHSLDSLHHLTSLTLLHLAGRSDDSTNLALIGRNCPSLSHLRLAKSTHTSKHDILAIILGQLATHLIDHKEDLEDELSTWHNSDNDALGRLRVPSEFLTPLCFTLRHLELIDGYLEHPAYPAIEPATAAFILRHLPLLEKLECCSGTEKAVQLLHKETEEDEESPGTFQVDFEQACRDAIQLHVLDLRNPRETVERPSSTFSGTLSLTKLEYVNIHDADIAKLLRAIELTCPFLKDVTFGEETKEDALRPSWYQHTPGEEEEGAPLLQKQTFKVDTAPKHLELALSKWPKLQAIRFIKVSPEYVRTIVKVFHKELKELSFVGCKFINLTDLERCTQLESLRISSTCSLDSYEIDPDLSADTFLPELKIFESKICLGSASALFENKSTLNRLVLECCHLNIQESIQLKWRSLETLHLKRCSSTFDMSAISNLIENLEHLKELILHCRIEGNDYHNDLARQIMQNASLKPIPINVKINVYEDVRCFLDPLEDEASNCSAGSEMVDEGVDSPPSCSSKSSDEQSDTYSSCCCSSDSYDPYESAVEIYSESEE